MTDKGSGIACQKSRRTLKEKTSGRTEIVDLSKGKMPKKVYKEVKIAPSSSLPLLGSAEFPPALTFVFNMASLFVS